MWVGPDATLTLAKGSKIGTRTIVNVQTRVVIGPDVRVSWDVQILDTDFHWTTSESGRRRKHTAPIVIEGKSLIGTGSIILKGVVVGKNAIVGAGSVVRRDVPGGTIVTGNPAETVGTVTSWGSVFDSP